MVALAIVAKSNNAWARELFKGLLQASPGCEIYFYDIENFLARSDENAACVYVPSFADRDGMSPDLCEARRVFQQLGRLRPRKVVLLSSALIYGTGTARQSLVTEDYSGPRQGRDQIAGRWRSLEALAGEFLNTVTPITVLRPATVLPSPALLSRRIMRWFTITLAGHDPSMQFLGIEDLAQAVLCAIASDATGAFNVAPDGVVPLHAAIKLARGHRLAIPRAWQRLARRAETLDYLRYPWTVSNKKIRTQLRFNPQQSSALVDVARQYRRPGIAGPASTSNPAFDEFGMDRNYIERLSRSVFKFLCNRYWRIEPKGLENVPCEGRGILVGTHRGFMPWDGVMILHLLLEKTGRIPRFLTHPGLFKFPFISSFVTKLGGVLACQESAVRILDSGELLGVFPEGVQGAFAPYRQAYQMRSFGRDTFVKLALRHRAPIIPYVTVGSAEIYPVFAQIKSRRWTRYSDWPCLPISTFPFLPFPLPTKWHVQFLPAIHLDQHYGAETAWNASTAMIKEISQEVRRQMQTAFDSILSRRRSWFRGSVFQACSEPPKLSTNTPSASSETTKQSEGALPSR